jgi:hypothetical protein
VGSVKHVDYPHPAGYLDGCEACEWGPCQCEGRGGCASSHCKVGEVITVVAAFPLGYGWESGLTELEAGQLQLAFPRRGATGHPGWTWQRAEGDPAIISRALARLAKRWLVQSPTWYVGETPAQSEWVNLPTEIQEAVL